MFNNSRLNFAGRHLRIAANPVPPLYIGETRGDEYHLYSGSDYEFISFMAEYFNFTWSLINFKGNWGQNSRNGSYTGLIGAIASGQCDFGMGVSVRNKADARGDLIDLTHDYLQARITFVTVKNEPIPLSGVLVMPFGWANWALIALTVVVLVVCGRVFVMVHGLRFDLDWMVFSAFLQEAPRYRKKANASIHFLIQLSWMAGLILLAAYGGAIISSLTANLKTDNVDTLFEFEKLAWKGKLTPLMIRTVSFMKDFKEYRNVSTTYDTILRSMQTVRNVRDGFHLMIEEKLKNPDRRYALIYPYPMIKNWCDMLGEKYFHVSDTADSSIFTDKYTIAFQAGSPLVTHFNRIIQLAIAHGFLRKWQRQEYRWSVIKTSIIDTLKAVSQHYVFETKIVNYQDLGVVHLREHFALLACGLTLATLTLVIEIGWVYYDYYWLKGWKRRRRKRKRRQGRREKEEKKVEDA